MVTTESSAGLDELGVDPSGWPVDDADDLFFDTNWIHWLEAVSSTSSAHGHICRVAMANNSLTDSRDGQ